MRRRQSLTLAFAGDEIELSRDRAVEVADYLWKGLHPGSVTSAAKLTRALSAPAAEALVFEPYEVQAIRSALAALRLLP